MKGEVLNYDDNSGQGQISGADGIRYSFSRADLKQLMPISRGTRVDFDFEGKQARDIYVDVGGPAVAPMGMGGSQRYTGAVEPDLGMFGYFIRAYTGYFANFSGRARRKEYWGVVLFSIILSLILCGVAAIGMGNLGDISNITTPEEFLALLGSSPLVLIGGGLLILFALIAILPGISLLVRRLHDIGQSGWIALLLIVGGMIPFIGFIASIATLVIACIDSQPFVNKYGPPPKVVA